MSCNSTNCTNHNDRYKCWSRKIYGIKQQNVLYDYTYVVCTQRSEGDEKTYTSYIILWRECDAHVDMVLSCNAKNPIGEKFCFDTFLKLINAFTYTDQLEGRKKEAVERLRKYLADSIIS